MSDFFWHGPLRTIRYDASAEKSTENHEKKGRRQQDQVHGIEWRLARRPEDGDAIGGIGHHLLVVPGQALSETGDVWIVYSFDDEYVTIHAIHFPDAIQ